MLSAIRPVHTAAFVVAALISATANADGERPSNPGPAPRPLHWVAATGGFIPFTGPGTFGPAIECELYPGGRLGRLGAGFYYRGYGYYDRGKMTVEGGMVALGIAYEAAASRPTLTLGLHGEFGYDYANSLPVVGGGLRSQLIVAGPFALAANLTGHLFLDGIDTSLGIALTLTAGFTR